MNNIPCEWAIVSDSSWMHNSFIIYFCIKYYIIDDSLINILEGIVNYFRNSYKRKMSSGIPPKDDKSAYG